MRHLFPTRSYSVLVLLVVAGFLTACGLSPTDLGRCSGPFPLTVDQVTSPSFSWTPSDCPVYSLAVLEGQSVKWYLFSASETNRLRSPVRYDHIPDMSFTASQAGFLFVGIPYRVQLTAWTREGRQVLVAETTFVKQAAETKAVRLLMPPPDKRVKLAAPALQGRIAFVTTQTVRRSLRASR